MSGIEEPTKEQVAEITEAVVNTIWNKCEELGCSKVFASALVIENLNAGLKRFTALLMLLGPDGVEAFAEGIVGRECVKAVDEAESVLRDSENS